MFEAAADHFASIGAKPEVERTRAALSRLGDGAAARLSDVS
jgi:hypothetical protein